MVRTSSSKSKKEEDKNSERTWLKSLAIRKEILSDIAAKGFTPLCPTKQVIKHHGKDIQRKSSQRKNRFLFSFPGLLAPVAGGKIGQLKNLGTQNPILYLDFPQGQMKLFGTIVYPENRYLTLQFSRGGKNVMCEDYFDNMIVFSDAWWIGRKDENPDEAQLDFPKELSEAQGQLEYDFKGGAGAESVSKQGVSKTEVKDLEAQSPETKSEDDFSDIEKTLKDKIEVTPVRHSERTAGRKFKFAEVSPEDDTAKSDADISEGGEGKKAVIDVDSEDAAKENCSSEQVQSSIQPVTKSRKSKPAVAGTKSKEHSSNKHSSLVQATLSTLFKKVEEKVQSTPINSRKSSSSKASTLKLQHNDLKQNIEQAEVSNKKGKMIKGKSTGTRNKVKKKECEVEDEDIEEFSSSSKDTSGSDEDWAA